VQQTVAHLGELDVQGRARARGLARAITGDREQSDLFIGEEADELIPVRLKRIRLERGRTFGDVWLGWTLWRALKLDEVVTRWLPEGREAVPWATMAAVLVLARLCEPSSELHIAETWYRGTDRKSTRLNSSHVSISYAVFCLKKKKITKNNRFILYVISTLSLRCIL